MKEKMTRKELENLFPKSMAIVYKSPDGLNPFNDATRKKHRHIHNPSRKPFTGIVPPSEYRRKHMGKNK